MSDNELERWLDGELGPVEAELLLAGLDDRGRTEARALAAVACAGALLAREAPSPDFAARAMARIRTRPPPRRSVWSWLRTPRLSPIAAMAGAAIVAGCAFGVAELRAHPPPGAPEAATTAAARVSARLALRAPLAREVSVAGDWNGWRPELARMRRGEDGVWTLDVPLVHGRYQYMFVVDGTWVPDPAAPRSVDDGFGGRNAVLDL